MGVRCGYAEAWFQYCRSKSPFTRETTTKASDYFGCDHSTTEVDEHPFSLSADKADGGNEEDHSPPCASLKSIWNLF